MTTTQVNGYINSIEEMEALPDGAVVRNGMGTQYIVRHPNGPNDYIRFEAVSGDRAGQLLTSTSRTVRYDNWWTLVSLPEARDTPRQEFPYVGAPITAHSQWAQLPHGTRLRLSYAEEAAFTIEVRGEHRALISNVGAEVNNDLCHVTTTRVDGGLVITDLPEPDPRPDWIQVGHHIESQAEWRHLPHGTVLAARGGGNSRWTVERHGNHLRLMLNGNVSNNDLCCNGATRADGFLFIDSLPGPTPEPEPYVPPVPTFNEEEASTEAPPPDTVTIDEFKQHVRTASIGQATSSGIDMAPVFRALERMGLDAPTAIQPGHLIHHHDNESRSQCPDDSTLVDAHGRNSWYRKRGDTVEWLRVGAEASAYLFRVIRTPDGAERPRRGNFDDIEQVWQLKQRIWEIGHRAKLDNSWCGDFERAMHSVGIRENIPRPSPWLTAEQVRELPEGTIVEWRDLSRRLLLLRYDGAPNPAGTVPIGPRSVAAGWSSFGATVVWRPDDGEPFRVPSFSRSEMGQMPPGTVMVNVTETRPPEFVKTPQGTTWTYNGDYQYEPDSFYPNQMAYTHIPVD